MFSQVAFPSPNVLFLYERSAKLSDSIFYQNNSTGTLEAETWMQLYDEMYFSAHDTLPLKTHTQVENYGLNCNNDTISLGIMDYEWYYLDANAMTSNTFFNFDTINSVLSDVQTRPYGPYLLSNIFAVAPMQASCNYISPTYRIDPYLFFSDVTNSGLYTSTTFRIDFGDGSGWHYFDPNVMAYYTVDYLDMGEYEIIAELLNAEKFLIKSSKSIINIVGKAKSNTADAVFEMPGINVGVYHSCNVDEGKVIIYLEGFDLLDMLPSTNRNIDRIYAERIHSNYIEELRNFNYSFYVVDWKNSRIDIRYNALHVVNLIEKLKNDYSFSDEQFVIIGESMGGLVARYTLTFMETGKYKNGDFTDFFVEDNVLSNAIYLGLNPNTYNLGNEHRKENLIPLMHKTRELITNDSPHQGANIPLSLQVAYAKILNAFLPGSILFTNVTNLALGSQAAKQMLLYHLDGKVSPSSNVSAYLPSVYHNNFFNQLSQMGNYPKFAKLMALSSGAINGEGQRVNLTGSIRTPNDILLQYLTNLTYKIFGKTIPLLKGEFTLRTNPSGNGNIYKTNLDLYLPIIQLSWFKVKISVIAIKLLNDTETALNVRPYCVGAGGYLRYTLGNKNIAFGFVPLQSSLDYGKGLNLVLNHNIQAENINTKLSRTPFDVILGYADGRNQMHCDYRDEGAFNITGLNAVNCSPNNNERYAYYDAANQSQCDVKRGLLNIEIGDEEMYIENFTLNRPAVFQAQFDVRVNERNPYYFYTTGGSPLTVQGIYSKQKSFAMTPQASAKFFHNQSASPSGIGFSFTNPLQNGLWSDLETQMDICVQDFSVKRPLSYSEPTTRSPSDNGNSLALYPNPSNGTLVVCAYEFTENSKQQSIEIVDAKGKILNSQLVASQEKLNSITIDLSNFHSGMYFVIVSNGNQRLIQKLIIQ